MKFGVLLLCGAFIVNGCATWDRLNLRMAEKFHPEWTEISNDVSDRPENGSGGRSSVDAD